MVEAARGHAGADGSGRSEATAAQRRAHVRRDAQRSEGDSGRGCQRAPGLFSGFRGGARLRRDAPPAAPSSPREEGEKVAEWRQSAQAGRFGQRRQCDQ